MIQRIVGLLLMVLSVTTLPPIGVALFYGDGAFVPFVEAFVFSLITALVIWWPVRKVNRDLTLRDGCLVVTLFWVVFGLYGALPLYLDHSAWPSYTDAVFESVSGLTTTGATIVMGLDHLPHALLYYRAQLHWLGGMGIIVLAVAVLPMLGIGGMQLYRAETPGPMKDSKLTPRIRETAKALWIVYIAITLACALCYWLAGMGLFDAVTHAFATMATGGFSNYDDSFAHFHNRSIELVAMVFMLIAGTNFSLHYVAWRHANVRTYWRDPEFVAYIGLMLFFSVLVSVVLFSSGTYTNPIDALVYGSFQWVSMGTSTGFTTANYTHWPSFLPTLLVISSAFSSCAGSTGGGIKVIRCLLLFKHSVREVMRTVHPNAEITVKIGGRVVSHGVIEAVCGFFAAYVMLFVTFWLLLMGTGLDAGAAFSAVATCINNMGPGQASVAMHFADLGATPKWLLIFAMLLGRLEIFTLLAVLTPAFWRR